MKQLVDAKRERLKSKLRYKVSQHKRSRMRRGSLVDRGANGGILGADAHVIRKYERTVDVTGIDNHELNSLPIVDGAGKITTHRGTIVLLVPSRDMIRTVLLETRKNAAIRNGTKWTPDITDMVRLSVVCSKPHHM